jgi:hypothetical protein
MSDKPHNAGIFGINIPDRVQGPLREVLQRMKDSGQSEAKVMAEVICDSLADCEDDPARHTLAIAAEIVGWGKALMGAACPQFVVGERVHWTDPDEGKCSGDGVVYGTQGHPIMPDSVITLSMDDGGEAEVLPHELTKLPADGTS